MATARIVKIAGMPAVRLTRLARRLPYLGLGHDTIVIGLFRDASPSTHDLLEILE